MRCVVTLGLLLALGLTSPPLSAYAYAPGEKVVCYYGSWAVWRPGNGKFDVDDIDPFLCTHYIFGFTAINNQTWTIEVVDPWNELCPDENGNNCAFDRFVALKQQNPSLKAILAVGGWNEGSEDFSMMTMDPSKRKTFIDSSVKLLTDHGFDGLDVDWEYPTERGGRPVDKENFVILFQELRAAFDQFSPPLLLSAATSPNKLTVDEAYDLPKLVEPLDTIHVMGYDYHGAWQNYTHHNAPLCGYYLDWGDNVYFNVHYTLDYYLSLGVPKEKMVLGIPTYGRCWTLDDIDDHGILAPAHAPGPPGPYTKIPGTLGANEICERLQYSGDDCTVVHDQALHEPYFYCRSDRIWCGYDDENSVYLKARLAKNEGLAGIMVWTIDTDDFRSECYSEPFYLIKRMKRALHKPPGSDVVECNAITPTVESTTTYTNNPQATTTTPSTTVVSTGTGFTTDSPTSPVQYTTTATPATTTVSPVFTTTLHPSIRPDCFGLPDGTTFPHSDCNKYWECVSGQGILEMCGPGTVWDAVLEVCNWEDSVDTSNCNVWICEVDNTYYPHHDCDKYYWCYGGSPHVEVCPNGLYWNQNILQCDYPTHVDTNKCNIP
ncbi:chitinase-3-like protein 1 [Panulirus ornatus]|uniref:chitinase-3-like protein 1 n=1 Tax=Panulirus ornatus TaxID=150431 RepID=UPI003A85229F